MDGIKGMVKVDHDIPKFVEYAMGTAAVKNTIMYCPFVDMDTTPAVFAALVPTWISANDVPEDEERYTLPVDVSNNWYVPVDEIADEVTYPVKAAEMEFGWAYVPGAAIGSVYTNFPSVL